MFVCGYSAKAKIFALYIAHFANFVLKICINLGKNILICCKTLNKQRFSAKCLVGCKYLCTFAAQLRTKGNKHNEDKKQEAARHITGHRNTERCSITPLMTAKCSGFTLHSPHGAKGRTAKIITRVMQASYNRFALITFCLCAVN